MTVLGSVQHLTGSFYDANGNLFDPTTVNVTITPPSGAQVVQTATHVSVGLYSYDYTTAVAGQHQYYFTGTGATPQVTNPDVFTVTALTTGALIGLADAKLYLQLKTTTPAMDAQLLGFIQSATSIINSQCGYTVSTLITGETVTPTTDGVGRRVLILSKTPVLSVQTITPRQQGMPTIDITTLNINPESGIVYLANWFQWFGPQIVSYTAGRSYVPGELQDACRIIIGWLWETQRGGAVAVPNMGGEDPSVLTGMPGFPTRAFDLMRLANEYAAPGIA